jgi:alpha-mannosidase
LKRRKADQALILRGYNMADETKALTIEKAESKPVVLNLLEELTEEIYTSEIQPYEIRTIGLIN